ncbi:MAG: putative DNA binding domain-containing protein [Candidatus Methanoperedens sp.]|nr:putative DNA binding domain-containing protein [Candidatus Methanoperedens sp.]
MNKSQFEQILEEGEGTLIEFKQSFSPSLAKEISAFANTAGGRIFIGVDDHNNVVGCPLTNEKKSRIQDVGNNCIPRVHLVIDSFLYDDKEIIVVTVPESRDKPVQCSDGFFLREGANSQKMRREEIFYYAQKTGKIRFETQFRTDFKYPADFDETKFKDLIKRIGITQTGGSEDILHNLGMGQFNGTFVINNAGILFFGKNRQLYLRQAYVTCVLYKGKDKVKILDRKDFREDPLKDYENAITFLQQHLRLEYEIKGAGPRLEIPEIPYEALREGILNAIIHRDYMEEGARVMIEIFDDRVEISNPGELLFNREELGRKSVARNPVIFDMFYRLDLIEKVGSGINRIRNAVAQRGLDVKFEADKFFTIILQRPESAHDFMEKNVEASTDERADRGKVKGGQVEGQVTWGQVEEGQVDKTQLAEDEIEILTICSEKPLASSEILKKLGHSITSGAGKRRLNKLIQLGLLIRTIPDKPRSSNQKYRTTEDMAKILKNK